jgi:hypothetical protein
MEVQKNPLKAGAYIELEPTMFKWGETCISLIQIERILE